LDSRDSHDSDESNESEASEDRLFWREMDQYDEIMAKAHEYAEKVRQR
jgi:hypothetical protein